MTLPWEVIKAKARAHGIEATLVAAFCHVESGGEPFAVRYEPHCKWLYEPEVWAPKLRISNDTETMLQKCSWGLMQIMGATAREEGFTGYLPELCLPATGLEFGCRFLKRLLKRYPDLDDAIAAYNAGRPVKVNGKYKNQSYVDKIRSRLA